MSAPGKSGSRYVHSDQERDNSSHDDLWGVNVVELVGENDAGTALNRVLVDDSGSISIQGGKATSAYVLSNIDDSTSTEYYGYEDADGNWYIKKLASDAFTFAKGTSNYATAWTNRASQSYASYSTTF